MVLAEILHSSINYIICEVANTIMKAFRSVKDKHFATFYSLRGREVLDITICMFTYCILFLVYIPLE